MSFGAKRLDPLRVSSMLLGPMGGGKPSRVVAAEVLWCIT